MVSKHEIGNVNLLSSALLLLLCTQLPALAAAEIRLKGPIKSTLSINQAMSETLMKSPRAASLRLQLGIAKSGLAKATELANPTIFMDNGYRAEFTYRYGASVPVEMPWKLAFRLLAAKQQIKLADLEIAKGLWALRGDIRRAYTEVILSQERHAMLSELAALYQHLQSAAEKRFIAGEVAQIDVYRAELAHTQASINREQMQEQVRQTKQVLSVLLGRSYDSVYEVPRLPPFHLKISNADYLPNLDNPLPELPVLINQAMNNRLEIKIATQSIATNGANLKVALGNVLPNPTIGVGSSVVNGPAPKPVAGDSIGAPGAPKTNFHGFFFQVFQELPIFNFQQGDISKYRATNRQFKAELQTQKNLVEAQVVEAYRAVAMQRQKIHAYHEKALKQANEIARLTQRSYQVGQIDINSALVAQQANVQVRHEYLDAVYAYQIAYTNLEQSIGGTL
ncbi:MAG: TolC family protein [Candidatus Obscuribacterales bacterium]|jgi:outer membrane protein TolC